MAYLFMGNGAAFRSRFRPPSVPRSLMQTCGGGGTVGHRRVGQVGNGGEAGHLPIRGEAVPLERREHVQPSIYAVARLEAVAEALSERAKVLLERGSFRIPGRPEGAVEVLELRYLGEAPLMFRELSRVRLRGVLEACAHEAPSGVVGPSVVGTGEDEGVALVVPDDLHPTVPTGVEEGTDLEVFPVPHEDHLSRCPCG